MIAMALLASAVLTGALRAQSWDPPRTAWGHPDLQGNWTNATLTPLTRPAGREAVLSAAEVAEIESGQAELVEERAAPSDPNRPLPPGGDDPVCIDSGTTCYNEVYRDPGDKVAVVNGEPRPEAAGAVEPADGGRASAETLEVDFTGDDAAVSELLREMVGRGLPVLRFTESVHDLEDVFMHATQGIVS